MNILMIPDISCEEDPKCWAIGRLAQDIIDNNPRFNFYQIGVHPREIVGGYMKIKDLMEKENIKFDLIHFQYWNSAIQLMQMLPELKDVPSLLTHHNHHSLNEEDWSAFTMLNEMTNWGVDELMKNHKNVIKIPHGVDLNKFSYIKEYPPKEPMVGYVGRIVPWKHLKEICEVSNRLKYKVIGCGYIDKPNYWQEIPKSNLIFHGGMGRMNMLPVGFEVGLYRKMTVFVMYSTGNKESGTLPLLHAMARGVPVIATHQGMARDIIKDGENGIIFNEENFEAKLKMLMEDKELREKLRKNALKTIRNLSIQRFARNYAKAYYKLLYKDNPVVSVIIPTFNRSKQLIDSIISIEAQEYPAKEIIVIDDGSIDDTKKVCTELKKRIQTPLLYLNTDDTYNYNLAKARNMGAVESLGDILLFMDDRLKLDKGALEEIAKAENGYWYHGCKISKGKPSTKRSFIENFSWMKKRDFVQDGMFCERMNKYGGLSEITRLQYSQKVNFVYNDKAKSIEIITSRGKNNSDIWKAKDIINKLYY